MKERTKQLIEEYKETLELLRVQRDIAMDEGNVFLASKLDMDILYFEEFIEDPEEPLTL